MKARWWWIIAGVLACVAIVVAGSFRLAVQHVPDFYAEALAKPVEAQRLESDECVAQAAALASTVRKKSTWSGTFTEEQINGWMAVDLAENHAQSLPKGVSEPRIRLTPGAARVAWKWRRDGWESICSVTFDVSLVGPHEVAVRLKSIKAGALPLPLNQVLDTIRKAAADAQVHLRWMQQNGDPVAIVTLPPIEEGKFEIDLDTLAIEDGQLVLAGHTKPVSPLEPTAEPRPKVARRVTLPKKSRPDESKAPPPEPPATASQASPVLPATEPGAAPAVAQPLDVNAGNVR